MYTETAVRTMKKGLQQTARLPLVREGLLSRDRPRCGDIAEKFNVMEQNRPYPEAAEYGKIRN